MIKLYFVPSKLPRTMTRREWKETDRWCRVQSKKLAKMAEEEITFFSIYGSTMPPDIREDYLNKMINPPLLMGPYMDEALRP